MMHKQLGARMAHNAGNVERAERDLRVAYQRRADLYAEQKQYYEWALDAGKHDADQCRRIIDHSARLLIKYTLWAAEL